MITIDLNIDKIRPLFSRIGINNFDKLYDLSNDIFPKIKNILRARYNLFKMDWRKSKSLESLLIFVTDVFNDFFLLTDSLTRSNKSKYKTTPQDFVENYLNITENSLIVVTGDAGIGKTPWIEQVIDLLLENNKRVDGLISKKIVQSDEVWSHDLIRISNGDKRQLTTMDDIKTSTSMGKFNFYDESIAWGNAQLMAIDDPDHIIIDEIGLLEFEEQGLLPGLQHIFKHYDGTIILTIRHSLKNRIRDFLKSKLDMSRNWNFDIIEI